MKSKMSDFKFVSITVNKRFVLFSAQFFAQIITYIYIMQNNCFHVRCSNFTKISMAYAKNVYSSIQQCEIQLSYFVVLKPRANLIYFRKLILSLARGPLRFKTWRSKSLLKQP